MMPKDPAALLREIQHPPQTSYLLLQLFVIALIGCSLLVMGVYIYFSGVHTVSEYRRQLNASAHKAQMFMNQRESLLRTIAASAVRVAPDVSPSLRHDMNRQAPQPVHLTLPGMKGSPAWEIILTERLLREVERAGARLIYSLPDAHRGFVLRKSAGGWWYWVPLVSSQADYIVRVAGFPENLRYPVVWLRRSDGGGQGVSVHAPVDRMDVSQGWLGLEFSGLDAALSVPGNLSVDYALFDSHGRLVLESPGAPDWRQIDRDYFGFERRGWMPSAIVFSQSLGAGGLRVMYSITITQLLLDSMGEVGRGVLVELLLLFLAGMGAYGVRSQWLIPARRQHAQLVDSLALNRALIAAAPVGLVLLLREGGLVLRANVQAWDWMARDLDWRSRLAAPGEPARWGDVRLSNDRVVHVRSESLRYRGLEVVFCIITDVTAQKEVETSLIRARQLAEDASQAKTRFLATMSHEIRTPLYGLMGVLELLDVSGIPASQRHYLETLRLSADALARTVNDALDLSRIEAGRLDLILQPFDLLELADGVVAAFMRCAESKGLHLYAVTDIPTPLRGRFLGDARRISQVLGNLISNAIKFTEAGQVVLRVGVRDVSEANVRIRFQICDTGIGVDPEALPHLFDPYFRTGAVQERRMPGTGLGLSICRQMVQHMQGSLQAVSQPGLGTRIRFELPLSPLADTAADHPRLEKRPIHVDGLLPEVVSELCRWLCQWGGLAVPYRESGASLQAGSVLVQAWPASGRTLNWGGPIVRACPAGTGSAEAVSERIQLAPAHSVLGIARVVETVQRGAPQLRQPFAGAAGPGLQLGLHVLVVDDNRISQEVLADRQYSGCILGMTADTSPAAARLWEAVGMGVLLIKPLSIAVLRERLQTISSRSTEACPTTAAF